MKLAIRIAILLLVPALASPQPAGRLDDGLLDPEWFQVTGEWRQSGDIDYLWVKPGFTLKGRTLRLDPWTAPVFLGKERDARDSSLAIRLSDSMPRRLERALASGLKGYAEVSRKTGDVVLAGRFVDCNAGSRALRWATGGPVSIANATWDLKLVDAATGETLAALHHRAVSGADTRDPGEKIDKWLREDLVPALRDDLSLYLTAGPAREGSPVDHP
jgi:hypothetical protein